MTWQNFYREGENNSDANLAKTSSINTLFGDFENGKIPKRVFFKTNYFLSVFRIDCYQILEFVKIKIIVAIIIRVTIKKKKIY